MNSHEDDDLLSYFLPQGIADDATTTVPGPPLSGSTSSQSPLLSSSNAPKPSTSTSSAFAPLNRGSGSMLGMGGPPSGSVNVGSEWQDQNYSHFSSFEFDYGAPHHPSSHGVSPVPK